MTENRELVITDHGDDFSAIRDRHEQQNLEASLKRTLFMGYSPKGVHTVIKQYKDTMDLMQSSFENQLRDIRTEMERVFSERSVLKQQLGEELEKSKEVEASRQTIEELQAKQKELERAYQKAQEQRTSSDMDRERLEAQLKASEEKIEKLREEMGNQGEAVSDSEAVRQLRGQLEAMAEYNESLTRQQESLESQLSSMRVINQELEKMAKEYDMHKGEMQEYREKCLDLRQENDSLMLEMESTGVVLADILEQVESKEAECEELKQRIAQQSQQVIDMMKEKLELQSTQVSLSEEVYRLETQLQESRMQYEETHRQLEEMKQYFSDVDMGRSKIIPMPTARGGQPAGAGKGAQIDNSELLDKAKATAERLKQQKVEEMDSEDKETIPG